MAASPYRIPHKVAEPWQPPTSIESVAVLCAESAVARWREDSPYIVRTVSRMRMWLCADDRHAVYGDVTRFRRYAEAKLGRGLSPGEWARFVGCYRTAFDRAFVRRFGGRVDVNSIL